MSRAKNASPNGTDADDQRQEGRYWQVERLGEARHVLGLGIADVAIGAGVSKDVVKLGQKRNGTITRDEAYRIADFINRLPASDANVIPKVIVKPNPNPGDSIVKPKK